MVGRHQAVHAGQFSRFGQHQPHRLVRPLHRLARHGDRAEDLSGWGCGRDLQQGQCRAEQQRLRDRGGRAEHRYTTRQIGAATIGSGLTDAEAATLHSVLRDYLTDINAVYSPEAAALLSRMTVTPSTARKQLIDALIATLVGAGIWAKLDALYLLAAHDAQAARLNWIADRYNLTAVNSPTFTTDRGYAGTGAAMYLDTGFNPATAASRSIRRTPRTSPPGASPTSSRRWPDRQRRGQRGCPHISVLRGYQALHAGEFGHLGQRGADLFARPLRSIAVGVRHA